MTDPYIKANILDSVIEEKTKNSFLWKRIALHICLEEFKKAIIEFFKDKIKCLTNLKIN